MSDNSLIETKWKEVIKDYPAMPLSAENACRNFFYLGVLGILKIFQENEGGDGVGVLEKLVQELNEYQSTWNERTYE